MTTEITDPSLSSVVDSTGKYILYQPILSLTLLFHLEHRKRNVYCICLPIDTNCDEKYVERDYTNDKSEAGVLSSSCY